ncbi:MAG: division plane positioning ATPase MipZ [Holosporaceae bacterium]|jgi:chromosome partitioning protein|nr:division plane positioning ATPase MipZ [Holosporaceae bacterium]
MKPYIIVFGNEKGGTGKSTLAVHVSVYLLNLGFRVGTIDVDARQGTFTQYLEHRKASSLNLELPQHMAIIQSQFEDREKARMDEYERFCQVLQPMSTCDYVVIDTPGNDTFLSQVAHSSANTLITPLNESFVDLDVLVKVSADNLKTMRPSIYAEMVWNQRKERARKGLKPLDWIVVKNRLNTFYSKNRGDINIVLEELSKRIGFRLGVGFSERVIFRELFLSGMTLLDMENTGHSLSLSHVSARQELRELIDFMKLPCQMAA